MQRTIEKELAMNGHSFFQTVGDSMEPLLHNRKSTVVIEAKKRPLKRYDVALYRRPSTGAYVLHRVVKVLDDAYLIRGDNRLWQEKVPDEWVIGVMIGYYQDEQNIYISCDSEAYRQYLKRLPGFYRKQWLRALPGRVRGKIAWLVKRSDRQTDSTRNFR